MPDAGWRHHEPTLWGAFTAYVALQDSAQWPERAFNAHSKLVRGEGAEGNDAYLSFSKRGDISRCPPGYRVLTLSTHTRLAVWKKLSPEDYAALKNEWGQKLLEHLKAWTRSEDTPLSVAHCEFGTPRSFERYTSRLKGHVGGLPMTPENTLLSPPSNRTRLRGLYQIGDTSFPGQSIFAGTIGALSAVERLEEDLG